MDEDTVPRPPAERPCYTPCQNDLVKEDGSFVTCGADRLIDGCVGDLVCNDGSCTPEGVDPEGCAKDVDCPVFQTCIQRRCYSNCDTDADCTGERICHLHVCRETCELDADESGCPSGYACISKDGVFGTCLPVKAPSGDEQTKVSGTFELSRGRVALSNVKTSESFTITNHSPGAKKFTVHKRGHSRYLSPGEVDREDDPHDDGKDCDPARDCPLYWLELGDGSASQKVQKIEVVVPGDGGSGLVTVASAGGAAVPRWEGTLEVIHPELGVQPLLMDYIERPEGRWTGTIHYFANFGDEGLADWAATQETKATPSLLANVGNALVQRWGAFRTGNLSWDEFLAVLKSTETESWRWASVMADCPVEGGACYPYDSNILGLQTFTSDVISRPVPTGEAELPFAMNLRLPDPESTPGRMEGLIDTGYALQYPGMPSVALELGADPATCQVETPAGICLVFVESLESEILLGGRYTTDSSDMSCEERPGAGYELIQIPWLLEGFLRATEVDPTSGLRYRYECRDSRLPWGDGVEEPAPDKVAKRNISLAPGNPVPDGRARRRHFELIDGALVNQRDLFVLFRESYESFLPDDPQPFKAYGYILLRREPADLELDDGDGDGVPDAFDGSSTVDARPEPEGVLDAECSPDLVQEVLGWGNTQVTDENAAQLVIGLIEGRVPEDTEPKVIAPGGDEAVHYLCEDTGLFDGGQHARSEPERALAWEQDDTCGFGDEDDNFYDDNGYCDDGGPGADTSICPLGTDYSDCPLRTYADSEDRVPCPAGSRVEFFSVESSTTQNDIANLPCQKNGTCKKTLNKWRKGSGPLVQDNPVWRCKPGEDGEKRVFCDEHRYDLRKGKIFYAATEEKAVFPPLYAEIDKAFRYKTKFRSRSGKGIGFAPAVCQPDSDQIPYCYDPDAIEASRERVDCLLYVWDHHYDAVEPNSLPNVDARKELDDYLCTSFSYVEACHPGQISLVPHDGFERLYSELLVMTGDDSYAKAFAARFDLAGSNAVSFQGSLFEPGGIDLSGGAGYEMYLLYRAAQYYQEALDRFYTMSPRIWKALNYGLNPRNFVTQETTVWYFDRLIRASTQKSRASSEIAKRYQNLNRPDLARSVIERAYTATYLEGILLAQLMDRIVDELRAQDRAQVWQVLEQGQRRYRMALLDMRNTYASITDQVSYFGLPPDHVPFLVTFGGLEQNAFEVLMQRAWTRVNTAKHREDQAIARDRAFETEAAQFQSELVQLRNNYENQLAAICGTMEGDDGKVYPAISRYAAMNQKARTFQDPCGLMGDGRIFEAVGRFEQTALELKEIRQQMENVLSEIAIEESRVKAQCELTDEIAEYVYKKGDKNLKLKDGIAAARTVISGLDRTAGVLGTLAFLQKCTVGPFTDCPTAAISMGAYLGAVIPMNIVALGLEGGIAAMEHEIEETNLETAKWQTKKQCDAALIDSNARTASLLLQLKTQQLHALKSQYAVRIAMGSIQEQVNTAKRLEDQQAEAEQLAINVQAARNDPNVRIYRDDTIINADIAFKEALQVVYKATRLFEYYTGQSYAELEKLFLIRSVQYGDYNLENYLVDLEESYYAFEEQYGVPAQRLAIISLRDDIMRIPRLDEDGAAISQAARIDMMRERLRNPALLDENGYLSIPFSTTLEELSPVTRIHKIKYMEAEMIGSSVGDTLGRVYVRQGGTSVVHSLTGEKIYYRFPERLAVINPFFNGNRLFVPEVYRNNQLRDRPYVVTAWELIVNQRDEHVNQDLDLQSLTDIRLYIYYTDFTDY